MKKGKDYIGVACGGIIFNNEGKVLLGQRGPKARDDEGVWDFPGGQIEYGERGEQAIAREVKEEFGIDIEVIELLNLVQVIETEKHWIGPAYICKLKSGTAFPREKDKFMDFKWIEISEIQKLPITTPCKQNLEAYKKKYGIKAYKSKG